MKVEAVSFLVMVERLEAMNRIREFLRKSPNGANITRITESLLLNRNLVSKCLDLMLISSQVELKTFGRSKIFRLPKKIPVAKTLSLSSDMTLLIDKSFTVIEVNNQFLKFTGLSRENIVGHPLEGLTVDILMHRDILLNLKDALRGTEYAREIYVQRGDDKLYFMLKLIPSGTDDQHRQLAIVFENITLKKKAEIDLKSSEARYRAVVEDQTELICRMLPDTTIVFINDAWCKFFKRQKEDYIGSRLTRFLPVGERHRLCEDIRTAQRSKNVLTRVNRVVFPEYGERWLDLTLRGIPDDCGNITEIQLVGHDISELRKAENDLRASEENFRTIFDLSPIGVAIVTPDFRFQRVNPELCKILGYSEKELLAMESLHPIHPDFRELTAKFSEEMLKGSIDHYQQDRCYLHKDGPKIWLRATVRIIRDEAKELEHFLAMYEDITEKKLLEESLEMARFCMDKAIYPMNWVDASGRFIYVNELFCQIVGYRCEELLNMKVWDIDPLITLEMWEQLWQSIKSRRVVKIDSAHRTKDGTILTNEIITNYLEYRSIGYVCANIKYLT